MGVKIILSSLTTKNTGQLTPSWDVINNIYFKGFIFDNENNILSKDDVCSMFSNIQNIAEFKKAIEKANGQFSIIIKKENEIWLANDFVRSLPLFYTLYKNDWIISDLTFLILQYTSLTPRIVNKPEFITLGYVTGKNTLLENVFQVQACEFIALSKNKAESIIYSDFLFQKTRIGSNDSFIKEFKNNINNLAQKLIKVLNGCTAFVPLSGGYDSRLIVYLLKKANYKNVICYTYGTKNNYEVENARKTSEILGYRWIFIDYSELDLTTFLSDPEFLDYYKFLANHSSMFMMQEYFAVKYLKQSNIVETNSVFIPGHSGDMLGGSHFMSSLQKIDKSGLVNEILDKYYILVELSHKERLEIKHQLLEQIPNGFLPHSIFENILIKERQAKFINNSARVYNFFGHKYYMPFWDRDLVNYFVDLPFELRLYKNFYIKTLQQLFEEYGLNFKNELQPTARQYKEQSVKKKLVKIFPLLKNLKKMPENDIFRSGDITRLMIDDMKLRSVYIKQPKQFNSIYTQWYLSKLS
jgi:asparagine synthase (glutamine-hydrolysing)